MKRLLPFLLLLLPFMAVGQDLPRHKKPKATEDANIFDLTKNQGTSIVYSTPQELKAKVEKDASLKMWDEATKAKELNDLPKGGWMMLTIGRSSITAADMKWFSVVVKDATGTEKTRKKLMGDSVPSPVMVSSLTYWRNMGMVFFDEPLATGDVIYLIDDISKTRHEYLVKND